MGSDAVGSTYTYVKIGATNSKEGLSVANISDLLGALVVRFSALAVFLELSVKT